jgi:hypothetical protein
MIYLQQVSSMLDNIFSTILKGRVETHPSIANSNPL